MSGEFLSALKEQVLRQIAILPTSTSTLVLVTGRPRWAVEAALASLVRDGMLIRRPREFWKIREQKFARRRV